MIFYLTGKVFVEADRDLKAGEEIFANFHEYDYSPIFTRNPVAYDTKDEAVTNLVYCLNHKTGLHWIHWKPDLSSPLTFKTMSTISFSNVPTGLMSRCDWVIGNRWGYMGMIHDLRVWGDVTIQPKTIFVRTDLLQYFHDKVLPHVFRIALSSLSVIVITLFPVKLFIKFQKY